MYVHDIQNETVNILALSVACDAAGRIKVASECMCCVKNEADVKAVDEHSWLKTNSSVYSFQNTLQLPLFYLSKMCCFGWFKVSWVNHMMGVGAMAG